ncbi:MAG: lamin tail domain-containing protein, partial [Candidatus Zixiibacteriota bacterium]
MAEHVVISEVSPTSTPGEYVELYNPTSAPINMNGWYLDMYAGDYTFGNVDIASHGYYLIAEISPISGVTPDVLDSTMGLSDDTATSYAVLKTSSSGSVIDQIGWGGSTATYETQRAPAPGSGNTLERKSSAVHSDTEGNGYDTDNNANDFYIRSPQPQNSTVTEDPPTGIVVTTYKNGYATSSVYDAGNIQARWTYIDWAENKPASTNLVVKVRFDNNSTNILSKAWTTVTNGQTLGDMARYAQYRAEFTTINNSYTAELENIRLRYKLPIGGGIVPENWFVSSEPNPLVDSTSRVGAVAGGAYTDTSSQNGVYENINEYSMGGTPSTETDYEAATVLTTGTFAAGSTDNLDVDDTSYYEVNSASSGGGSQTVWTFDFESAGGYTPSITEFTDNSY